MVAIISLLEVVASSSLAFRPDEGGTESWEHIPEEEADEGRDDCSNNWRREQDGKWPCCRCWGRLQLQGGGRRQGVAVAGGGVTAPDSTRPASGPAEQRRR